MDPAMGSGSLTSRWHAFIESGRCLECFDAPCTRACPAHIDIPSFIGMIRSGNVLGAAEVVKTSNALANVCGRICPEEIYCQSVCTRAKHDAPVLIRELHFFATRTECRAGYRNVLTFPSTRKRAAVVGGGPAGLACAFELAKAGCSVTLFDPRGPGGVPKNSIPSFRIHPRDIECDLRFLKRYFTLKRRSISDLGRLRREFDAVFLGVGLGRDRALGINGEHLPGVIPVLRFLEKAKSHSIRVGNTVVIVGGGNVSLDAAATAKRMGAAEVIVLYRRSLRQMKVWKSELEESRRQGIEFRFLTTPVEITGTRRVRGLICRRMRLSRQLDDSGRPVPVEVRGSDFQLAADTVIVAVGQEVAADLAAGLKRTGRGFIAVDRNCRTSLEGVFAGGDATGGEGTIVQSVADGKAAARSILNYLANGTRPRNTRAGARVGEKERRR